MDETRPSKLGRAKKKAATAAVVLTQGVILSGCLTGEDMMAFADFVNTVNGVDTGGNPLGIAEFPQGGSAPPSGGGGFTCCRPGASVVV